MFVFTLDSFNKNIYLDAFAMEKCIWNLLVHFPKIYDIIIEFVCCTLHTAENN